MPDNVPPEGGLAAAWCGSLGRNHLAGPGPREHSCGALRRRPKPSRWSSTPPRAFRQSPSLAFTGKPRNAGNSAFPKRRKDSAHKRRGHFPLHFSRGWDSYWKNGSLLGRSSARQDVRRDPRGSGFVVRRQLVSGRKRRKRRNRRDKQRGVGWRQGIGYGRIGHGRLGWPDRWHGWLCQSDGGLGRLPFREHGWCVWGAETPSEAQAACGSSDGEARAATAKP